MSNRLRVKLLASTLLIGATVVAAPAMAQVTPPAGEEQELQEEQAPQQGGEIVVTGSRIQAPNITSVAPVQSVGAAEIESSGLVNVQEVLLRNPAFGTPALGRTNSAFLTSGTGVASVDLRDLGSDRTLVLINGRRVVAGVPGTATVDLNVIPSQFVQRIDVLTGGSSSLYGSDAVAGVVNFIYKDNFEGLEGNVQYGVTERGDDARYQANLTFGGNFADNRGNLMVHMGYSNEEGVLSRQRSNTFLDDISEMQFTGDPADYFTSTAPFLSGFAPQGSFGAGGYTFTYAPNGQLQPCFTSNGPTCNSLAVDADGNVVRPSIGTGVGPNGFNRQAFRTIAVPVERYLFATRGRFDVTDSIRVFAEGTYSNTSSSREIEPFALSSADIFPASGGLVPIETVVNGVTVLNPFVPGAIAAQAVDQDGDGLRDITFSRRLSDIGTRNGSTSRDFYRFVVGLEGDLFEDRLRWDISYNYGRTSESQRSNGQVNVLNFANALSAITDADGNIVCSSLTAQQQGCVPINIFGDGSITPEMAAYVVAPQSFQTRITQQQVQANLSGSLFELPAGPLGFAIGAEYRKESSVENNDALTNAGLNGGNAIPDTAGSFDVRELYGELNVPILADVPFFQALNLRAAGRVSDYSTVGTVYTWNVGGDWSPVEGVRLRGTYARSTRAPNIGELFTGPSQTFPAGLQDPCVGISLTSGGATGDRCRAEPGVIANITANGVFTLNQSDLQGISGFNSGNPDLDVEKSRSYTFGVVLSPTQLGGALGRLNLSVDYYNISIEDAITAPPRQFILNQCYQQGDAQFCDLITRRPNPTASNNPGTLEFIDAPLFNGGETAVEGIDAVLTWDAPVNLFEQANLGLRVSYTHVIDAFSIPIPGAPLDPFAGEIGTSQDRFTATGVYSNDTLKWTVTGTYISGAFEDDQFLASFGLEPDAVRIPSQFYLDTQVSFNVERNFEFYVGADNLLDKKAPNILSGSLFNTTGTDTAADVYDVFGRRYYAGARIRF